MNTFRDLNFENNKTNQVLLIVHFKAITRMQLHCDYSSLALTPIGSTKREVSGLHYYYFICIFFAIQYFKT